MFGRQTAWIRRRDWRHARIRNRRRFGAANSGRWRWNIVRWGRTVGRLWGRISKGCHSIHEVGARRRRDPEDATCGEKRGDLRTIVHGEKHLPKCDCERDDSPAVENLLLERAPQPTRNGIEKQSTSDEYETGGLLHEGRPRITSNRPPIAYLGISSPRSSAKSSMNTSWRPPRDAAFAPA